jgi:integrase
VRLWPQAEKILRDYFAKEERGGGLGRLLFPSQALRHEAMITDFRKSLDAVAARCGWEKGEIRSKMCRHTYCSARLQTLDGGAPVSEFTVGKELGHGGPSMVRKVYAHLGQVRHRSEVVEYRLEHHREALGDRLTALETLTN